MCGIYGIWHRDGQPVDLTALRTATSRLRHRGPDDEGYLLAHPAQGTCASHAGLETDQRLTLLPLDQARGAGYSLAFGFRRLAILDLSPAGHQPMASADGRFWIVFNGEIYNYIELRAELQRLGHCFRSGGDTEVILAAYAQWGEACLNRLNGMWAFAIWDRERRTLFLARDRFGVKPLYYAAIGQTFHLCFGNQSAGRTPRAAVQTRTAGSLSVSHRRAFCPVRSMAQPSSLACARCRRDIACASMRLRPLRRVDTMTLRCRTIITARRQPTIFW